MRYAVDTNREVDAADSQNQRLWRRGKIVRADTTQVDGVSEAVNATENDDRCLTSTKEL